MLHRHGEGLSTLQGRRQEGRRLSAIAGRAHVRHGSQRGIIFIFLKKLYGVGNVCEVL